MMNTASIQVPVLIVGAGPVGVSMANLLGEYGIETLMIDKSPEILEYPRAVGIDDEAVRAFQAAGLAEPLLKDMIQNVPMRMYSARKKCFAEILPKTREFGWFRRNLCSQPLSEKTLRDGLSRYPHVKLRVGVELTELKQDSDGVTVRIRDEAGVTTTVRTEYLLASDGARSTVRELLKVPYVGKTHEHKWVVIECDSDPLDAPYTALHCEPRRPYVCLRLPYGLRRWEFMLFPGEDGEQMLAKDKVNELLRNHVEHPEKLNVIRARVYTHNSRVAERFVIDRVCLVGDAAHITPPWIGQGLNAGMRDAFNVAWKVAWILKGRLKPEFLETYHQERHKHTKAMIDLADMFGAVLSMSNRLGAWVRDAFFLSIKDIPSVRDWVLQMKFKPMPRFDRGVILNSGYERQDDVIGRMFIQPNVELDGGREVKLDDAIQSNFALLSWRCDPLKSAPADLLDKLRHLGCKRMVAVQARCFDALEQRGGISKDAELLQDVENLLNFWFQEKQVDWVLIRPDRFVAAAGKSSDAVVQVSKFCQQFLQEPQREPARRAA